MRKYIAMRALNVVHYMIYTKEDLHHQMYSETKCGVKAPTYNRTNNNPNGHSAQQRLCPSGYAVDGNRNNDGQLAGLSGRVDVDGNRSGSGSTPCVVHQEEHLRYSDERW